MDQSTTWPPKSEVMQKIPVNAVHDFLLRRGWVQKPSERLTSRYYEHPEIHTVDGHPLHCFFPNSDHFADYPLRVLDFIENNSQFYELEPRAVLTELQGGPVAERMRSVSSGVTRTTSALRVSPPLHPVEARPMTDSEFLTAFEECTVARKDWTHEAHIRMAWLYLTRLPATENPLDRVRSGIKKLNATFARQRSPLCMTRIANPKDARGLTGYHETITAAFVALIASRIAPGEDFAAFRDHNPDLFDHKFPTILKHYSPARLYSPTAKKEFIEPDLIPLPRA